MTARRETLILEVISRLEAVTGVSRVVRQPNAQPSTSHTITLDDQGQRVINTSAQHNRFIMRLIIGGYISGTGATSAAAINEFYAATVRAMFADGAQLGGLAELITQADLQIDSAPIDQKFTTVFELSLDVQFIARTHDPALL